MEKPPHITSREVSSVTSDEPTEEAPAPAPIVRQNTSPWNQPGFYRQMPWDGLLALILALGAGGGMAAIIVLSHDSSVSSWQDWYVTPAVCLSITSIAAGTLLRYAYGRAVVIAWWVSASRERTTVADLHKMWAYSTSLKEAVFSGTSFNTVALATLALALLPASSPLVQRASRVGDLIVIRPATLKVLAQQELPDGATGYIGDRSGNVGFTSEGFSIVVREHLAGSVIPRLDPTCKGECRGVLEAAGFEIVCQTSTVPFNISAAIAASTNDTESRAAKGGSEMFNVTFTYQESGYSLSEIYDPDAYHPYFNLTTLFKPNPGCEGELTSKFCTLVPATVGYHVLLTNTTITLDPAHSYHDDKIVRYTPARSSFAAGPSTIGGIWLAVNTMFKSVASMRLTATGAGYQPDIDGVPALTYGRKDPGAEAFSFECPNFWIDPTEDILAATRDLIFRMALRTANDSTVQDVAAQDVERVIVYKSQYLFLGLALIFLALGTCCVLPLTFGWWRLGRSVTFSPVEIAKAFEAPVLAEEDPRLTAKQLVEHAGHRIAPTPALGEGAPLDEEAPAPRRVGTA